MELNDEPYILGQDFRRGLEALLRTHTPSITNEIEGELEERAINWTSGIDWREGRNDLDTASLALRTCSCGTRIDGFYEYIDHLRAEAGLRPTLGTAVSGVSRQETDVPNG